MTNGTQKLHGKVMRNAQHAPGMNHGSENKRGLGNEIQCTFKYGARSMFVGIHICMFFALEMLQVNPQRVAHDSTIAHGWDGWHQSWQSHTWSQGDREG